METGERDNHGLNRAINLQRSIQIGLMQPKLILDDVKKAMQENNNSVKSITTHIFVQE